MKQVSKLAGALILLSSWTPAQAVVIDFDAFAPGLYSEPAFNALFTGISFRNTTGNGFELRQIPGSEPAGYFTEPHAVLNTGFSAADNATVATFEIPVDRVAVTMGDFGEDADDLFLNAYGAGNDLLASDYRPGASGGNTGYLLSVSAPYITYVEFFADGFGGGNSVLWDNFTYTPVEISESPALPMLLLGLFVLKGASRGRQRKEN